MTEVVAEAELSRGPSSDKKINRKIAFCVAKWNDAVLTWAWLRQYFLHRDTDEVFILHTGKSDNWQAGGPLTPSLDVALKGWHHQIISYQGSLQSNAAKFIKTRGIDVVVLSEDFPRQSGLQIVSVSDWVRQNITCPFIIIRASAVRNERLRLATQTQLDIGSTSAAANTLMTTPGGTVTTATTTTTTSALVQAISPASAPGRKVAIAYPTYPIGLHLIELAKQLVLLPQDEIFVVHCFSERERSKKVKPTAKSLLIRTITLGATAGGGGGGGDDKTAGVAALKTPDEEVTEEASLEFGGKELAGFNVHLGLVLRGDPRSALTDFCQTEGIELLVISTRVSGFIRKKFSGGSVSGYLIEKAPCPCLVAPLKALGLVSEDEEGVPMSPYSSDQAEWVPAGTSPRLPLSPRDIGALQEQLAEKDRTIAALREEVAQLRLAVFVEKQQ